MEQERNARIKSIHLDGNLIYERTRIVNQQQKINLSLKYAWTIDDPYGKNCVSSTIQIINPRQIKYLNWKSKSKKF